jgi:hypothetical protein
VFVAPFQAHAQKPVEFNGMVFDPPPAQGCETLSRRRRQQQSTSRINSHHHHSNPG